MGFREFVEKLEKEGRAKKIKKQVSKKFEAAGLMAAMPEQPLIFEKVEGSEFRTAANFFSTKDLIAEYFGIKTPELIPKMINALDNRSEPEVVDNAPCKEIEMPVDLDKLPLLHHFEDEGGNYVTSGIVFARDKELGMNLSFHRALQIGKNKFVMRILDRHLKEFIDRAGGKLDAAFCIGMSPNLLLAGATSVDLGIDEFGIANTLEPLKMTRAKGIDVMVPAETEFVLEGRFTGETAMEGPFVDLTGTMDVQREQPVFEVTKITHRKNPIYHALMSSYYEHRLLMGMPKEPTIFSEVEKAGVKCKDVFVSTGGCSWLHAIVQIEKRAEEDGKKAIDAALKGHKSCKHVFVVDSDIDIYNPQDVEWAMSTRFQADKDFVMKPGEKGSSIDPSADPNTRATCKAGFDLTKPLEAKGKNFSKVPVPEVDASKY
ncbi:MAG: UbiD family decarboxylase [Candidatus Diapherotrites archaeon]|nr:UbiD family decarboxylase [Candidatus Micrarchaeota archaeon]MBU1939969.1 UbiD family decarboxylase [Candidatus Micrarchaeota archaeon]